MAEAAGVNEMTVQGRAMLLCVTRTGSVVHLAAQFDEGRPAAPDHWLDPKRSGYTPTIEQYDRAGLLARRWAPLTLCAVGWLCMADTDAGALRGEHDPRYSPTCRRCLGRIDAQFAPEAADDRIGLVAALAAQSVEEHGSAQVIGVPGPQATPLRRAIQRELRRRLGPRGHTWYTAGTLVATHDNAATSAAVEASLREAVQRLDERECRSESADWMIRWDTWHLP